MSMIIKDNIKMMLIGHPTVADKYNVKGGILEADTVKFGQLLQLGSGTGYYKNAIDATADSIVGIALATNVKIAGVYPDNGNNAQTKAGEALNVMTDGYVAVEVTGSVETAAANIKENAKVYFDAATGLFTTDTSKTALSNMTYTGLYEMQGTKLVAEIRVR